MFDIADQIRGYYVYSYGPIDEDLFLGDPRELYRRSTSGYDKRPPYEECLEEIKCLLEEKGWEGDGDLKAIWFPPFVVPELNDYTYGHFAWFVKQVNNGTCWIASKHPLKFKDLNPML